jgi:hypothetical protein
MGRSRERHRECRVAAGVGLGLEPEGGAGARGERSHGSGESPDPEIDRENDDRLSRLPLSIAFAADPPTLEWMVKPVFSSLMIILWGERSANFVRRQMRYSIPTRLGVGLSGLRTGRRDVRPAGGTIIQRILGAGRAVHRRNETSFQRSLPGCPSMRQVAKNWAAQEGVVEAYDSAVRLI